MPPSSQRGGSIADHEIPSSLHTIRRNRCRALHCLGVLFLGHLLLRVRYLDLDGQYYPFNHQRVAHSIKAELYPRPPYHACFMSRSPGGLIQSLLLEYDVDIEVQICGDSGGSVQMGNQEGLTSSSPMYEMFLRRIMVRIG